MPKIAILQMNSGVDPEANLSAITNSARDASDQGAKALFVPEMAVLLDRNRDRARSWIESDAPQLAVSRLAGCAETTGIDIALGSMPILAHGGKWANRSMYFSASDSRAATYDKMHMFDVTLDSGETWRESSAYAPGTDVVTVADTPVGLLGLTICYDMRFPALFSALGQRRCDAIAVPAAFTRPTGAAHWHVLLRARAIEASAFVIAAAQVGEHEDGRATYGHSLVVDPWGEVLLDMGGEQPGLGICEIDRSKIAGVRQQIPSLANAREIPN